MTDLQKAVRERLDAVEAAKKAKRERQLLIAEKRAEIRQDEGLTPEMRDAKLAAFDGFLDSGGDVADFAKEWPELQRRIIVAKAVGDPTPRTSLPNF